jgi:two-component system chemotaxis response regulator CheY
MQYFKKDAEKTLLALIEKIQGQATGIRCGIVKLSQYQNTSYDSNAMGALLADLVNDDDLRIFQMGNGDSAVLSSLITESVFDEILARISSFLKIENLKNHSELYALDHRSGAVAIYCEERIEDINTKPETAESVKAVAPQVSFKVLDSDVLATLKTRKAQHEGITILVVEDDLFSQKMVTSALSKDYTVLTAKTANEAIEKYALNAPHVVFLDIGLPDIPGSRVLNKLIEMDDEAFVIMLSGQGGKSNVMAAMQGGAKGFVGKPFSKAKLLEYIQRYEHQMKQAQVEV